MARESCSASYGMAMESSSASYGMAMCAAPMQSSMQSSMQSEMMCDSMDMAMDDNSVFESISRSYGANKKKKASYR